MKKKKENRQEKLARWFDKGFFGVYRKDCPVCGSEFFTLLCDQVVCDNKGCQAKWERKHEMANQKPSTV